MSRSAFDDLTTAIGLVLVVAAVALLVVVQALDVVGRSRPRRLVPATAVVGAATLALIVVRFAVLV